MLRLSTFIALLPSLASAAIYELVQNISGDNFFDNWDYVNLFQVDPFPGAQLYVDVQSSGDLTFTDSHTGHATIKVDNTTKLPYGGHPRNSIKIITKAAYPIGSVWMIDLFHVPYGCGVQPVFWSMAPTQVGGNWPKGGSIGTFEALNKDVSSQMMLYTEGKCNASRSNPNQNQASIVNTTDCSDVIQGCATTNAAFPSYGPEFNNKKGGMYITELASTGISIWYFPRNNIPRSMLNSSIIDTTALGIPIANWPASICGSEDFSQVFLPQSLVIQIPLCNSLSSSYDQSCGTGVCSVSGNGSNFTEAYFEIGSVQVFNISNGTSVGNTGSATTRSSIGTLTSSEAAATTTNSVGKESDTKKHIGMTTGIITGSICGFLIIVVVALLVYKKRINTPKSEGEPPYPVPFFSVLQGNIDVLRNPMHALPRPKSPIGERTAGFNSVEFGGMAEDKIRPPSLATAAPAPFEIAGLLEENDMLRRRLAEVAESVTGGTPPPTYREDENELLCIKSSAGKRQSPLLCL